ncbi:hypothetical protein GCM10009304_10720 [Pseudomonas matsuisoli]|uniref:Uncharacterized protein n=2 Tax=Pseudomonas matsuisoli TaxID=1515666 RepID=A0A917UUX0_9PSED|nr:hypothetical protein GCM10009304_10720 [Pseudomonas matsuisoli]
MFGEAAIKPQEEFYKDWALEAYTATALDISGPALHADAPIAVLKSGLWANKITGIASEWSRQFPGYLAGAIEAAAFGVKAFQKQRGLHV